MKIDTGFGVEIDVDHDSKKVSMYNHGELKWTSYGLQRRIEDCQRCELCMEHSAITHNGKCWWCFRCKTLNDIKDDYCFNCDGSKRLAMINAREVEDGNEF